MLDILQCQHLVRAQQRMKATADLHHCDISFEAGDKVYLKLRPYRRLPLLDVLMKKLAPKFYGPIRS